MDIPLKSQPKVSTVNILDSKYQINENEEVPFQLRSLLLKVRGKGQGVQGDGQLDQGFAQGLGNHLVQDIGHDTRGHEIGQGGITMHLGIRINRNADQTGRGRVLALVLGQGHAEYFNENDEARNYKLRRYSETEKNNFDEETGHRIYDDGKIRPEITRKNSHLYDDSELDNGEGHAIAGQYGRSPHKIYSRSHDEFIDSGHEGVVGLEDEYIPGLDFGDLIYKWNKTISDQNLSKGNVYGFKNKNSTPTTSTTSSNSNTPQSRDASYLDLNTLHAKVAPQPIRLRNHSQSKYSFSKLHDFMKQRSNPPNIIEDEVDPLAEVNQSTTTLTPSEGSHDTNDDENPDDPKAKRQKSVVNPETGDVNYEAIITSLPPNFNDLPYSQRKKLVSSFSDSVDYSQFSLFAKNYLNEKFGSSNSSGKTPRSGGIGSNNGSFTRRSRRSSVNTVAGRLLALSSTTDLKKLQDAKPKTNVDEKGAIVMDHELGKVIGFGAWGTIRECTDRHGTVRAMKIVKSCRELENSPPRGGNSPSRVDTKHRATNQKVLQVFKKEITIWKQLHHPNILPLLKYYETEHAIFCIMNRIYGGTLFELVSAWGLYNNGVMNTTGPIDFLISKQRRRLKDVSDCTIQTVSALYYMHEEKGIVHGDLKLENVLVENLGGGRHKMILCDFGMSRIYSQRLSRKSSLRVMDSPGSTFDDEDTLMMRSKSSATDLRKPYSGGDSPSTRHLFHDDSKIGISNFTKPHGPSLQSVDLTPVQSAATSSNSISNWKQKVNKNNLNIGIDTDLPHSHIGSLPYAAPELLSPCPPPLGPLADIWALGVLMYTMCVGKLPFQHQYEPRLRAIITAGRYNKTDLRKACLLESILSEPVKKKPNDEESFPASLMNQSPSFIDLDRQKELVVLQQEWEENKDQREFEWLYDLITGCLELNITKRWDLDMITTSLAKHKG